MLVYYWTPFIGSGTENIGAHISDIEHPITIPIRIGGDNNDELCIGDIAGCVPNGK